MTLFGEAMGDSTNGWRHAYSKSLRYEEVQFAYCSPKFLLVPALYELGVEKENYPISIQYCQYYI